MKKVLIRSEKVNVAQNFKSAIYRKKQVNTIYPSCKEASIYHNLKRCDYAIMQDGVMIREVYNIK